MSVQNGERLVTKQDLADMYSGILPYLGGMSEVLANKFSKGDLYSTDEKMIGQWIDGKPLYQKSIEVGTLTQASQESYISLNTPNVDKLIKHDGVYFEYSDNNEFEAVFHLANSRGYMCPYKNDATNSLYMAYKLTFDISNVFVTVQYTKTTDSAISIGDDTDYSTEEKIIGTWLNGEPLYQKTVDLGSNLQVSTSWTSTGISVTNIDRIVLLTSCMDSTSTLFDCVNVDVVSSEIKLQSTRSTAINIRYFTIQYTKTTT